LLSLPFEPTPGGPHVDARQPAGCPAGDDVQQLAREGIGYVDVDIERDPAAADYVMSVNGGSQTVPTVIFPDGSALTNPSLAQVKQKLADAAS
jgi:mycoredoxin